MVCVGRRDRLQSQTFEHQWWHLCPPERFGHDEFFGYSGKSRPCLLLCCNGYELCWRECPLSSSERDSRAFTDSHKRELPGGWKPTAAFLAGGPSRLEITISNQRAKPGHRD